MNADFYRELFEDRLGLHHLGLENTYRQLVDFINRVSIPTYSNFVPCYYYHYLDLNDQNVRVPADRNRLGKEYYINSEVLERFKLPILGVDRVEVTWKDYDPNAEDYTNQLYWTRTPYSVGDILMGSNLTSLTTLMESTLPFKRYHELRKQNILYLEDFPYDGEVEVKIKTKFPNIASIPEDYRESFMNFCKLDLKYALWNRLKYIENVVTPVGNLDLKISEWSSAESERNDFIKELDGKTMADRAGGNYFVIL